MPKIISNRCDVSKCKGVCCTFLTFAYDRKLDEDYKYFLSLRGIEVKEVWVRKSFKRFLRSYLKVPMVCREFDPVTFRCRIYERRPLWCATNPTKDSPFIPPFKCSALHPELDTVPDKDDADV